MFNSKFEKTDYTNSSVDCDVTLKFSSNEFTEKEKTIYEFLFNQFDDIMGLHKLIKDLDEIGNKGKITGLEDILNRSGEYDKNIIIDTLSFLYNRLLVEEERRAGKVMQKIRENKNSEPLTEKANELIDEAVEKVMEQQVDVEE